MVKQKKVAKQRGRPKGRAGGGGKLSRSETVTVRLDPKLKYAADLAARKHRRTISSFIEWAVEEAVKSVVVTDGSTDETTSNRSRSVSKDPETAFSVMNEVWDVDEADRFVRLASKFPFLLTYDEGKIWKVILKNFELWKGKNKNLDGVFEQIKIPASLKGWEKLRLHFDSVKKVASGEMEEEKLKATIK